MTRHGTACPLHGEAYRKGKVPFQAAQEVCVSLHLHKRKELRIEYGMQMAVTGY